jgi:hypothetical protein
MKPFTSERLDSLGCSNPGCTDDHSVVFFHPRCHPDAGTWTSYDKRTSLLTIECKCCGKPFVNILVADDVTESRVNLEPAAPARSQLS